MTTLTTTNHITGGEKTTAWILIAVAIAANAAGYILGWFHQVAWYDDVVHGYTIFATTLLLALYLYGASLTGAADHGILLMLTVAGIGLALGALWEIAEWAYDQWIVQPNVIKGKRDTILDLIWDSLGALAAGLVATAMAKD